MSKLRVTIDLMFTDSPAVLSAMRDFYDTQLLPRLAQAVNIDQGGKVQRAEITLHRCYHDELTGRPCDVLFHDEKA